MTESNFADLARKSVALHAKPVLPNQSTITPSIPASSMLRKPVTGMTLGPPMEMRSNAASRPLFSPDGRRLFVPSSGLEVWRVPAPAADEPERLRLSIEVRTGLEFDESSTIQKLSHGDWLERKRRLEELGGPCDVR